MKICDSLDNLSLLNNYHDSFVKDANIKIRLYDNCMYITDLANALKVGKTCRQYVVMMEDTNCNDFSVQFLNWLDDWGFSEFIESLFNDFTKFRGIAVTVRDLKAVNVFSPFVQIKPIKLPEKWTLPHVWKAILAGQIKKDVCDGRYTDDYANDAACNYERGELDLIHLARKLIESPSGWWVRTQKEAEGLALSVNCHHFDNNTLYI